MENIDDDDEAFATMAKRTWSDANTGGAGGSAGNAESEEAITSNLAVRALKSWIG